MRYAIFSDIHSNVEAFEAVISALKTERIDEYICGGDIVGYGAEPGRCIEMAKEISDNVICGNHDLGASGSFDISSFTPSAREAVLWTAGQLKDSDNDYFGALKYVYEDSRIAVVHGSLDEPEEFYYILRARDAVKTFDLMKTRICFVGHTHAPAIFRKSGKDVSVLREKNTNMENKDLYIVNVGSVGQPRDGDPRACYAVFDADKKYVEIKRAPYDIEKAQRKIRAAGLPPLLADRLSEGR